MEEARQNLSELQITIDSPQTGLDTIWTPGFVPETDRGSSDEDQTDDVNTKKVDTFNDAISTLSKFTDYEFSPLSSQLKCDWKSATQEDRVLCTEKAEEACKVICDVIAPGNAKQLFESLKQRELNDTEVSGDLIALMAAYKNAPTRRMKIQILSIYAYRYPVSTLLRIHEPYEVITKWQVNQARAHARISGPGTTKENVKTHRVRIDRVKVDHFLEFINRPYFYQDVAYGMRTLVLDSGEKVQMPNIVRTVSRSTIIMEYLKYCEEEGFSPLSRSSMYRILEVRESSQRTSLRGLDNTATDGAAGFQTLERIVEDTEKLGAEKTWSADTRKSLKNSLLYLKVKYPVNCADDVSLCADHCRRYALSDPKDSDFQQLCDHEHLMKCSDCETLKFVLEDIEDKVQILCQDPRTHDQRDDILHDLRQAKKDILEWKSHIMRSVNQEKTKEEMISRLDDSTVMAMMDWAMKFQQTKYREKQQEWLGKRGLSWHVSSVVSKHADNQVKVQSYIHLIDSCSQDWYSVFSILESVLKTVKKENPVVRNAHLRSDEAGCYHINMLVTACHDVSRVTGVNIVAYNFSEPQHGKDICDRIICPLKAAIAKYCSEGHDILCSKDMYTALKERQVRGTTASVAKIDESRNTLDINKIEKFSTLHNFVYEKDGIRVRRAFGIGEGKLVPYKSVFIQHQISSSIEVSENEDFFKNSLCRELTVKGRSVDSAQDQSADDSVFQCPEPGCLQSFRYFSDLEIHIDIGKHDCEARFKDSFFDSLRREWADMHTTISNAKLSEKQKHQKELVYGQSRSGMGWALYSPQPCTRFPDQVRQYLIKRFQLGEKTGNKADPCCVANEMRSARNERGERMFSRENWLKASQIKSFFSRRAASLRKQHSTSQSSEQAGQGVDDELVEWEEEQQHQLFVQVIQEDISVRHPIMYGDSNLCEYFKHNKLSNFKVPFLREILEHFEIPYTRKDRKKDLIEKLQHMAMECSCFVHSPEAALKL